MACDRVGSKMEQEKSNKVTFKIQNPYIHATRSDILDLLVHTDFTLMSPIDMIEKYNISPMTGEINGGGFDSVDCKCDTCFGTIHGNTYNLEQILQYANMEHRSPHILELNYQINIGQKHLYSNINIILIYAVRCIELGHDISEIITLDLIEDIKITQNALATLLFFDTWLKPVDKLEPNTPDAIYTHFTFEHIKTCLKNGDYPDFHKIYQKYSDKDLPSHIYDILNDIFTLPKRSNIKSGWSCTDKDVELTILCPFTGTSYKSKSSGLEPRYTLYRLMQNISGYSVNDVLEKYVRRDLSTKFWPVFHHKLCLKLDSFIHRTSLLEKISTSTMVIPKFTTLPDSMDSYPLIAICDDDKLVIQYNREHRAIRPLKLGVDINILATDTDQNRTHLIKYLDHNNLNCKVILFSDLKQYAKSI